MNSIGRRPWGLLAIAGLALGCSIFPAPARAAENSLPGRYAELPGVNLRYHFRP